MGPYIAYYLTGFLAIPVLIFALICQGMVKSRFKKYSRVASRTGMTGADAAYRLLQLNGITDVRIRKISGNLTDHYDPRTKEICLSEGVFDSRSVAAIGVACHEAGHACQHAQNYAPLRLRNAAIPATRIGSWLGIPMVIFGMALAGYARSAGEIGYYVAFAGLILYSLVALFQLLTLPVEFNASKRALQTIRSNGFLVDEEYSGARKVLTAAALTYVASLASSLVTLLRLALVIAGGRRR